MPQTPNTARNGADLPPLPTGGSGVSEPQAQTSPESELARVTLTLLDRVQLTGAEVPAFSMVQAWLRAKMQQPPPTPRHPDPKD